MKRYERSAISYLTVAVVLVVVVVAAVGAYSFYTYYVSKPSSPLLVDSADLYTTESSYLYGGFSNATGIPYAAPKSAGSTALAAQIKAGSPVSVFISVSKAALEPSLLGSRSAGWGVAFVNDQMSIGYSSASGQPAGFQTVLNDYQKAVATNATSAWNSFFVDLTAGSVKVGISNPNTDPAGYRGWMVLEAAGQAFDGNKSYFVSRLLDSRANVTGASAAALVAPLQAGRIQFLMMYKSAALSHGLTAMLLPRHINLGDITLGSYYSQFTYATSTGVQKGGPVLLFATVPNNATETTQALDFLVYIVQHSSP
ncbi:MAG TPA: substrate-binding domain-containing protein, partial [Nitrososphaerales archaeon]|nr:substrate-binding domain-containing protein [Nitrososphaerales archaeon]